MSEKLFPNGLAFHQLSCQLVLRLVATLASPMSPPAPSDCRHNNGSTSRSLLDLVRSRDETSWRKMTELYGPLIYHWCRNAGLGPEDSADVLQDVFRSVMLHIETFEKSATTGSFRGWLWTVTRNKIRDLSKIRAGKARAIGGSDAHARLLELPDQEPNDDSASTVIATGGLTQRSFEIVRGEVKETTWLAFWRSTVDEVAPAAVADELGISIESVWQAKSRVLRRVRLLLQ